MKIIMRLRIRNVLVGVGSNSLQGDIQFLSVLDEMGCEPIEGEHGICMLPPPKGEGLTGGAFDFSSFSDQPLTLYDKIKRTHSSPP